MPQLKKDGNTWLAATDRLRLNIKRQTMTYQTQNKDFEYYYYKAPIDKEESIKEAAAEFDRQSAGFQLYIKSAYKDKEHFFVHYRILNKKDFVTIAKERLDLTEVSGDYFDSLVESGQYHSLNGSTINL